MASLGTSNPENEFFASHPEHCRRDLEKRLLPTPCLAQALKSISLPWQTGGLEEYVEHEVVIAQPHIVFHALYERGRDTFDTIFIGGESRRLEMFWDQMQDHPSMQDHPLNQRSDFSQKCIPIEIHFDAVPVVAIGRKAQQSVNGYSWKSEMVLGDPTLLRLLIGILWKGYLYNSATLNTRAEYWLHVCYSFFWLWKGLWPTHDEYDKPLKHGKRGHLAGGFYATIWNICGDLDAMADELGLNHASSKEPCYCCGADEADYHWNRLTPTAPFLEKLWTAKLWKARMQHRHRLLGQPGVGHATCVPDHMHVKHLGSDKYDYGSVLQLLTHHVMPSSPENNLRALNEHLKLAYAECQIPAMIFRRSSIRGG